MNFIKYFKSVKFIESANNVIYKNSQLSYKQKRNQNLKNLQIILDYLGNPEQKIKNYIHIGGTSGKGSVANYIHNIIWKSGKKSGLFTSPFLTESTEKYKINDKLINPNEFAKIVDLIKPALDKLLTDKQQSLTYFEISFLIAIIYFTNSKCDYFISEVGLGGEFDATNVIQNSKISVITHIDYDHTKELGNSLTKIAQTKSKIIKNNSIFITAEKREFIKNIFKKECIKKNTKYDFIDLQYQNLKPKGEFNNFFYKKVLYKIKHLGNHQIENAILAIEIAKKLKINDKYIKSGICMTKIPGRFEKISSIPFVIMDGAHNEDKISSVIYNLKNIKYKKLHLLYASAANKDYKKIIKKLAPITDFLYATKFTNILRKSANPVEIDKIFHKYNRNIISSISLDSLNSLDKAIYNYNNNDLILICGSFYLVGELRQKWISSKYILENCKII